MIKMDQTGTFNPLSLMPLRDEAICNAQREVEAAEADVPAAKDRAAKVIKDARNRLAKAYDWLNRAQTPLGEWDPDKHYGQS